MDQQEVGMRYQPDRLAKPILNRMDTSGQAFPKPGPRPKSQPKDGRLIETPHRYRISKMSLWVKQGWKCANCPTVLLTPAYGHRHHPGGRGMGGSRRDDAKTLLLCLSCHQKEHGR